MSEPLSAEKLAQIRQGAEILATGSLAMSGWDGGYGTITFRPRITSEQQMSTVAELAEDMPETLHALLAELDRVTAERDDAQLAATVEASDRDEEKARADRAEANFGRSDAALAHLLSHHDWKHPDCKPGSNVKEASERAIQRWQGALDILKERGD